MGSYATYSSILAHTTSLKVTTQSCPMSQRAQNPCPDRPWPIPFPIFRGLPLAVMYLLLRMRPPTSPQGTGRRLPSALRHHFRRRPTDHRPRSRRRDCAPSGFAKASPRDRGLRAAFAGKCGAGLRAGSSSCPHNLFARLWTTHKQAGQVAETIGFVQCAPGVCIWLVVSAGHEAVE